MPHPTVLFLAFATGLAAAIAGRSELKISPRPALFTRSALAFLIFDFLVLVPASAYFYVFHGDWFLLYALDVCSSDLLDLRADILKVSHHGARNGGTAIIAAADPRAALVGVGAGNRYGHPAPETLAALEAAGAAVFRTDTTGAVVLRTEGTTLVPLRLEGAGR